MTSPTSSVRDDRRSPILRAGGIAARRAARVGPLLTVCLATLVALFGCSEPRRTAAGDSAVTRGSASGTLAGDAPAAGA